MCFKRAAVLWTGGKDSCLALHRVREQGISVISLITFVPSSGEIFKAHSQEMMRKQAAALALPLHFVPIGEPYREGYVKGLAHLKNQLNLDAIVTGDIDYVEGHPNWISECCATLNLKVICPLWGELRDHLMSELLERRIQAKITWINHPKIPTNWVGRIIDADLLQELRTLSDTCGVDLCGENGEYHTMVVNTSIFSCSI